MLPIKAICVFMTLWTLTVAARSRSKWNLPKSLLKTMSDDEIVELLYNDPDYLRQLAKEAEETEKQGRFSSGLKPASKGSVKYQESDYYSRPEENFINTAADDGSSGGQPKSYTSVKFFGPGDDNTGEKRDVAVYDHLIVHEPIYGNQAYGQQDEVEQAPQQNY